MLRWADVAESDGDSSEEAEDAARGQDGRPPAALANCSWPDRQVLLARAREGLNVAAPEFIPTLSRQCPLVGICYAVAAQERQAPHDPTTAPPLQPAEAAGVAGDAGRRQCCVREDRAASLMPEASEEEWQHRIEMRRKELAVLSERLERRGRGIEKAASMPDPTDRTISRRQWKKATDAWFKALLHVCPEEGHGSVASTEEWQSHATTSTNWEDDGERESECSD